jgi:hypothetical protein
MSIGGHGASTGRTCSRRRTRSTVARTTSVPAASSRTETSWILRPSRSSSVSMVSGATGTGRIRSTVRRATRIGAGDGRRSTAQQISEEGAAPCCRLGSHGPPAKALVSAVAPSTR